ncbi:MAG: GyrI-like domain-containing protein [Alphaproteobacteria bacterium]
MCAQNATQDYEVKAGLEKLPAFDVVGVSVIVSDHENASEEINRLWERFFQESIGQSVDNRVDDVIYAVYSDYEGDHTKPYRLTIGYKINGAAQLGGSLHHVQVKEADYAMMSAAGEQPKALVDTWTAVWQSDLDRKFETDFEVYGQRFFEDGVHEVLVAIGVNL